MSALVLVEKLEWLEVGDLAFLLRAFAVELHKRAETRSRNAWHVEASKLDELAVLCDTCSVHASNCERLAGQRIAAVRRQVASWFAESVDLGVYR